MADAPAWWNVLGWFKRWLWSRWKVVNRDATVVVLGLDNAGKTSLVYRLAEGRVREHKPTFHPTTETVQIVAPHSLTLRTYDLGGHVQARRMWRDYYVSARDIDAILFVIDATDDARWAEASELVAAMRTDPDVTAPIIVVANKCDAVDPATHSLLLIGDQLRVATGAHAVHMCSVHAWTGFDAVFDELISYLS